MFLISWEKKIDALEVYDQVLAIDDKNADAYIAKGYTFRDLGRKSGELEAHRMAFNINPEYFVRRLLSEGDINFDDPEEMRQ